MPWHNGTHQRGSTQIQQGYPALIKPLTQAYAYRYLRFFTVQADRAHSEIQIRCLSPPGISLQDPYDLLFSVIAINHLYYHYTPFYQKKKPPRSVCVRPVLSRAGGTTAQNQRLKKTNRTHKGLPKMSNPSFFSHLVFLVLIDHFYNDIGDLRIQLSSFHSYYLLPDILLLHSVTVAPL